MISLGDGLQPQCIWYLSRVNACLTKAGGTPKPPKKCATRCLASMYGIEKQRSSGFEDMSLAGITARGQRQRYERVLGRGKISKTLLKCA
jgi:hypothetical protein